MENSKTKLLQRIERQKAKLARLEDRIGELCARRVDEEEFLGDLIRQLETAT